MTRDVYHRVYSRIWREPWTQDQRYLALYLLTCEHRTFEGLYRLPIAYAAADMGWNPGKVRRELDALEAAGFVQYDADHELLWIVKALGKQSPNGNQAKHAARHVAQLPPSTLREAFAKASETLSPVLAEALRVEKEKAA